MYFKGGNMNPLLSSIISILFILIGIITVLMMLKLQGDPKDKVSNKRLKLSHRMLGYTFLFIFLVMLFLMVKKVNGLRTFPTSRHSHSPGNYVNPDTFDENINCTVFQTLVSKPNTIGSYDFFLIIYHGCDDGGISLTKNNC